MSSLDNTLPAYRVLVVDDSRAIRGWLKIILDQDPRLEVVGEAADAMQAASMMTQCKPDVMVLDVEMPGKSGLDFLAEVMSSTPLPVVMFSSLTSRGSQAAITALTNGAVDCVAKPTGGASEQDAISLRRQVRTAAGATVRRIETRIAAAPRETQTVTMSARRASAPIFLGSSTGGVTALETVLEGLDGTPCPVIIAQHMPEHFLNSFCARLNENYQRNFVMSTEGLILKPGMGVICSGIEGSTMLKGTPQGWMCTLGPSLRGSPYNPCVDDLFETAAESGPNLPIAGAALLTGMGRDGAEGLLKFRERGVHTIAQDEKTSTVFGMPRAAISLDAACETLPLPKIGERLAEVAVAGKARP